jgi:hypothetical protein
MVETVNIKNLKLNKSIYKKINNLGTKITESLNVSKIE